MAELFALGERLPSRLRELGPERLLYESTKPGPGGNGSLLLTPLELLRICAFTASAATFPATMQVPRRTPRSLSLGSLGSIERHEMAIHWISDRVGNDGALCVLCGLCGSLLLFLCVLRVLCGSAVVL